MGDGVASRGFYEVMGEGFAVYYDWAILDNLQPKINPGDCYKIMIEETTNPSIFGRSYSYFSIKTVIPSFAVTYPNGGKALTRGQTYTFHWASMV